MADPAGNPFWITNETGSYVDTGPLAALRLACADPDSDGDLWSWLTGWTDARGVAPRTLRHRSMRGPALELSPERTPKGAAKNRLHLDVRLERPDDADDVAAGIAEHGGHELRLDWGDLPWRHFADASGNEFCLLPARP